MKALVILIVAAAILGSTTAEGDCTLALLIAVVFLSGMFRKKKCMRRR